MSNQKKPIIVAVDGPAGSGKSTICAKVSQRIGWSYVNTGALYRAVGLLAKDRGIDLLDDAALCDLVTEIRPSLSWDDQHNRLNVMGSDITSRLGSAEAGNVASFVAKSLPVRTLLLPVQRELALKVSRGAIIDGRDIGTVVFPDANLKIFMTASLEERARRRLEQLTRDTSYDAEKLKTVMKDIENRDEQDTKRGVAPLRKADDAVVLDTSYLDVEGVINAIIQLLRDRKLLDDML